MNFDRAPIDPIEAIEQEAHSLPWWSWEKDDRGHSTSRH